MIINPTWQIPRDFWFTHVITSQLHGKPRFIDVFRDGLYTPMWLKIWACYKHYHASSTEAFLTKFCFRIGIKSWRHSFSLLTVECGSWINNCFFIINTRIGKHHLYVSDYDDASSAVMHSRLTDYYQYERDISIRKRSLQNFR